MLFRRLTIGFLILLCPVVQYACNQAREEYDPMQNESSDKGKREELFTSLVNFGKIVIGKTNAAQLSVLFSDYKDDFIVLGNVSSAKLATFYFNPLKIPPHKEGQPRASASRDGKYVDFHLGIGGVVESFETSDYHKGKSESKGAAVPSAPPGAAPIE